MKQLTKSTVVTLFLAVGCILPQFLWAATATNRQAAGTTDYWTNNAIWTASPYPGSGPNESAYLTTNMAGSYTNVLNATLANSISNIVISNSLGTAWLVITNAVVTNAAMFVRNGGRLRIDNGGSLMSSGAMDRTDCRLYINSGGAFYQTTNTSSYFNLGYGTMSNAQMVLIGGTVPAVYDGGSNRLNVGQSGSAASLLLVDGNGVTGGAVVTNVSTSQTGRDSQFNTTVLTNGGLMLMKAGSFTVGQSGTLPSSSNVLIVVGNPAVSVLNMMGGDFVVGAGNNTLTLVSRGNSAIFDGGGLAGGAVLTNANNVTVGSDGSNYADLQGNRLVVTNGGSLFSSGTVTIGNVATNVSYIIDGGAVGSVVSNRAITIGTGLSRFARMSVANARLQSGGAVTLGSASSSNTIAVLSGALWDGLSQAFTIGSGAAMNNVMTVDGGGGAGSAVLTNVGTMTISSHATGVGNALIITNGARFFSGAVTLGNVGAASNNSYIVAGSTATNALITVGGFWNQMRVANSTIASAGLTLGGISNTVTVDPASVWNFSGSPLTINVNTGVALTVNSGAVVTNVGGISLSGVQQACYLTNAGSAKNIFLGTRGYLYVGGTANTSSGLHSNNLVLANQTFTGTVGGYNWIGINSSFNTLTLLSNTLWNANAEDLVIGNGYSASFVGASNNLVVVDGGGVTGGAVITNLNSIRVGWAGGAAANTGIAANNRMVITNGGCVSVAGVGYIGAGQFTNAIGNSVLVAGGAGATSRWDMTGSLFVPETAASPGGTNSSLVIDGAGVPDGAVVSALSMNVDRCSTVLVTNRGALVLGAEYSGVGASAGYSNSLMIVAGSRFDAQFSSLRFMSIGNGNNNNYNQVLVRGTNSLFNVLPQNSTTKIRVGAGGVSSWNAFRIEDYAVATGADFVVGYCSAAGSAVGNLLSITGGGKLYSGGGFANQIGYSAAAGQVAAFNTGLVAGVDSVWNVGSPSLTVGYASPSNVLWIADGAMVTNVMGLFKVGEGLATAPLSSGNKVVITNGAKLYTLGNVYVGGSTAAGQMGNSVLIDGPTSLWNMGGAQLNVGLIANTVTGNWVTIDNGGTLDNVGTLMVSTNNALYLLWGTLGVSNTVAGGYTNGLFVVGDGTHAATLKTITGGTNIFAAGLLIKNNASLSGSGAAGGAAVGVIVTNGAFLEPGVNGVGSMTVGGSNLTWAGGGIYHCEITNMNLNAGLGWDLVNVSTQLNLTGTSGNMMEIRMDSCGAAPAANFSPASDYTLKIMTYGSVSGYDPNNFYINTNAFPGGTSAWGITNGNNALYLVYRGANPQPVAPGFTWADPNSGNWSVGANWTNTVAPDVGGSNTYVLAFGGGVPAYAATNNHTNAAGVFQLNQLVLNAGSGSNQIVGSGALVFTNTGAALQQVGMGQFRIAHKLIFTNDPAMITGNGAGNMYLASNVTVAAAGRVLLQGQGAWTMALQSSNNLDGTLGMDAPNATLQLESDMALNGASGGSVTVSNGTVNSQPASGNVAIGLNVSNRRLLLTGPYSVLRVNSRPPLMIGSVQSASSSNCNVTVDSGARLYGALNVSYTTAAYTGAVNGCSLVITNGGQVFNDNVTASIIGYAGVTNVAAIVTGPNSTWNLGGMNLVVATNLPATRNSSLTVRDGGLVTNANTLFLGGISNTVSVANAGSVSANTLTVGDGTNSSANTLAVDNATVAIANNLIIGNNGGRNNALTVQNGAIVNLRNGTLAWGAGAAANNFIVVDGTSCITNVGTLALNDAGRTVTLANGAVDGKNIQFSAGGGLLVGTAPNIAPVNLVISNFTLNAGGAFGFADSMVGNSSSPNNTLTVGSGGQWNLGGRTLTLGMIANPLSTSNNVLKIDGGGIGGGAIVRNIGFLYVGGTYPAPRVVGALATTGNSLIVTNGGMLVSSNANIGNPVGPGAGYTEYISNNTAVVTGSGSSWTNIGTICIGGANANAVCNSNACWITSSGRVYTANLYIGRDSAGGAGSMNVVQIDGAGTVVAVTNLLGTGYRGTASSNRLIIANSATVIGRNASVYGMDQLLITDPGTVWTNSGLIAIGDTEGSAQGGQRGLLTITNGARVYSLSGGVGSTANNGANLLNSNAVVVTGSGSQWFITSNLNIGISGSFNQPGNTLTITQDGAVDPVGTLTVVTNNYLNLLGGTLGVANTTYTNLTGTPFTVGDGAQAAMLKVLGGTLAFNTGLTISTNATLAGSGVIQSATKVFGNLTPGVNGIGSITNNGAFSLTNNVVSVFDIATNFAGPGAVWDTLVVTNGTLNLGGTLKPVALGGYMPATNLSFMVMTSSVPLSGAFNNIADGTRVDVLTNVASPKAVGSIRVRINPQSVVLENFNLFVMKGTVFFIR